MIKRYNKDYFVYKCVQCGITISKEQFMLCCRCNKCNGGKVEC